MIERIHKKRDYNEPRASQRIILGCAVLYIHQFERLEHLDYPVRNDFLISKGA